MYMYTPEGATGIGGGHLNECVAHGQGTQEGGGKQQPQVEVHGGGDVEVGRGLSAEVDGHCSAVEYDGRLDEGYQW